MQVDRRNPKALGGERLMRPKQHRFAPTRITMNAEAVEVMKAHHERKRQSVKTPVIIQGGSSMGKRPASALPAGGATEVGTQHYHQSKKTKLVHKAEEEAPSSPSTSPDDSTSSALLTNMSTDPTIPSRVHLVFNDVH